MKNIILLLYHYFGTRTKELEKVQHSRSCSLWKMVKLEWRGDTGPNKGSPLIYDLLWECSAAFSNTMHESSQRRSDAVNRVAEVD